MTAVGDIEVIFGWTPGWRPACGWSGPWRLLRLPAGTVWIRPIHVGGRTIYFSGPGVGS